MNHEIQHRFTYHQPHGDQPRRYITLRGQGKALAELIDTLVPDSREKSLALTKLEEAIMWANAGIARNEPPPPQQFMGESSRDQEKR